MPNDQTSQIIAVYDKMAQAYARKIDEYVPLPERDKFLQLIPKGGHILDAGCGPGRDSKYFVEHGLQVIGVDLSEQLLGIARNYVPTARFIKQDLRYLQFTASTFDGIWAGASLLHLQRHELPSVIKHFRTLLKPLGVLFVLVKMGQGEEYVKDKLSPDLSRFFTYFSLSEIQELVQTAGFAILEAYTWNKKERNQNLRDLGWISCFARKDV